MKDFCDIAVFRDSYSIAILQHHQHVLKYGANPAALSVNLTFGISPAIPCQCSALWENVCFIADICSRCLLVGVLNSSSVLCHMRMGRWNNLGLIFRIFDQRPLSSLKVSSNSSKVHPPQKKKSEKLKTIEFCNFNWIQYCYFCYFFVWIYFQQHLYHLQVAPVGKTGTSSCITYLYISG